MGERPRQEADWDTTSVTDAVQIPLATRRDRAHLIVLAGENLGQMFRVDQSETIIGRAPDGHIRVQDGSVSRRHSRIIQVGGEVWIEDMGSSNGTYVNEGRIVKQLLRDGDKIQMGSTTILKFTYADELEEAFRQRMYDAALYDALTKAFNKRHFLDRLPIEISHAKRHRTPLSLLMIDADHFKQVNDRYGHVAGDHVLTTLAQIVRGTLRAEDLFARYGGEEFCVLCRDTPLVSASGLAERLRAKVETFSVEHHAQRIPVTISIGVASWLDQPDGAMKLISDADAALYDAKRSGRNRVVASATHAGL
jgi:diguanylate cyclase (GGDEF)-like protein